MNAPALTLYFDGNCPFCATEMGRLGRWDRARRLAFVDIAAPGFDPRPLGVGMDALNREMHSLDAGGKLLVGIDSMVAAYGLAGRAWLVLPLRVPLLRPLLAALYRQFACRRYAISRLLGYKGGAGPACRDGACARPHPFLKK
ncbi:thiol-disulfide oxidoreductase DCC family protein [Massilia glaciei]|uniref:thiol-disulfide oxidoreductase DCC family protein n=1 Tax=Massilia glaciei TaxID=1524097 RepID=UPI001E3F033A|nr:DCC1-like thiol-disulfide oxidoreductase family protein [Massilia glaciei]